MSSAPPKKGTYNDGELWFTRSGSMVTLGITRQTSETLGDIKKIEFPQVGDDFDTGDVILELRTDEGDFEVTAPAAGWLREINSLVENDASLVNEDSDEEGWLVKIEVQDPSDLQEYADTE